METNYSEALLRAMEIISTSVINSISYDKTVLCTVIDDTYAKDGKYTVSNGSAKFDAYSSLTNYKNNNVVYVSIPDGDYDNQKFIVGKKVSDIEEPFVFTTPFDTIVDLTNNIVTNQSLGGLLANGDTELVEIFSANNLNYKGFTRFGIQGQFKSWLQTLNVVKGSFGLKITIKDKIENTKGEWEEGTHFLILDSSDMYGNPYSFEGFFQHEKVFDISTLGIITGIKCDFYQIKNSFADRDGVLIPTKDEYDNDLMPNLFVKDVYLCAGYNLSDITDEYLNLYTFDTSTYIATQTTEENKKTIHLRWVHMDDGKPIVIENDSNLNYEIRWYHYRLGAPSADSYSGVYWDRIETDEKSFSQTAYPDITKAKEMYKVIVIYNNSIYRSNIITFENEKEVANQPTVDLMQALSIQCDDGTYGNYYIYDEGNSLIDSSQGKMIRQLTAYFKSEDYTDGINGPLTEASSITWTFPTVNTMFVLDGLPEGYEGSTYSITKQGDPLNGNTIDPTVQYRIRSYYSSQYLNNTIQVSIVKDGQTYPAQKEFSFGQAGTTGTDTTLVIDFDDNVTAVTVGDNKAITLSARLYDYENNEVNLKEYGDSLQFEWSWFSQGTGINIQSTDTPNKIELKYSGLSSIDNLYIIQATVKGWGNYDLTAFLPIPLRTNNKYKYIIGANQVIYLSDGTPLYYKKPYLIEDGTINTVHSWSVYPNAPTDISIASIKNDILVPPKFYIKDGTTYGVKCDNVWMQPVLVIQNRYPSSVINEWDGKELTIDHDNGSILSTMIAAGSKDSQNRFSGVMLGDWAKNGDAALKQTGLYGFNQGAMSFGFKEDGTGFIGKDGKGRILFDGDKSIIQSQLNLSSGGTKGMLLDLDDGLIKMSGANGSIILDSKAAVYPLKIGDNFTVDWTGNVIGVNSYFTNGNFTGDLFSENASISGTITASEINGGKISGAKIFGSDYHLISGTYTTKYLGLANSYSPSVSLYYRRFGFDNFSPIKITSEAMFRFYSPLYQEISQDVRDVSGAFNFYDAGLLKDKIEMDENALAPYKMGQLGIVLGSAPGGSKTKNLGIDTSDTGNYLQSYGILLKSATNIGIRLDNNSNGGIYINVGEDASSKGIQFRQDSLVCTYSASEQKGIYARFA